VRQARHLYSLVENHSEFEAASNPPMSAICIRYRGADPDEARSKALHVQVVGRVEQSGKFWISRTELKGKTWFRINPVNFRTRTEHMEPLLTLLEEECRAAVQSARLASA
jgi:glutamate/tyrosine decarboxylase-like PLP-dependent enzyme